jgi:hypothetical protein
MGTEAVPIYSFWTARISTYFVEPNSFFCADQPQQEGMLTITIERPSPAVNVVRPVLGLVLVALMAAISISMSRSSIAIEPTAPRPGRPSVLDSGHHLAPLPVTITPDSMMDLSSMTIHII